MNRNILVFLIIFAVLVNSINGQWWGDYGNNWNQGSENGQEGNAGGGYGQEANAGGWNGQEGNGGGNDNDYRNGGQQNFGGDTDYNGWNQANDRNDQNYDYGGRNENKDNNRDADSKKDQIEDDGDCNLEGSLEEELATLPDHLRQKARKLMCKYQKEGLRPEEASIGKASPQLHEETNDLYSDLKEAGFNFDEDEDEDEDEDGLF